MRAHPGIRPLLARRTPQIAVGLVLVALLEAAPAAASSEFASGPFTLPEVITPGLDGSYLLSDADNDEVYSIPAAGGPATSGTPMGFRVFGEIALPSGYAQSGQYLAYGTNSTSTSGVAALTGTSGLGSPVPVINVSNGWFANAVVAPESFGAIAKGQVIISDQKSAVNSSLNSTIEILNANGTSLSTFTSLPAKVDAFGLGFAPESFGADGGDLFVTDSSSGKLYVINAAGNAALFANLPLPVGFTDPGLRYLAWAPAGFTIPDGKGGVEDLGGDLLVSIAAQNGGGGSSGEIDVLDSAGDTVAHYLEGNGEAPLDPRGMFFVDNTTLLVANADPGIQLLTPADFRSGSPAPEPSTWAMMLLGFAGLGFAGYRASRKTIAAR